MFQAHKEPVRGIRYANHKVNAIESQENNHFHFRSIVLVHPIINLQHAVMMVRCVYGIFYDVKKSVCCVDTVLT